MLDAALRRKLSEIARGSTRHDVTSAVTEPIAVSPVIPEEPVQFCEFRPCVRSNEHGEMVTSVVSADEIHPHANKLLTGLASLESTLECHPCRVAVLDLETTGLRHVPMFLAGVMQVCGDSLSIRHMFARNYAEEKSLLCELGDTLDDCDLVITYNGNSFDLPFIKSRCMGHLLPVRLPPRRLDVFYLARRRWKHETPNCKLQTLESYVCGRCRTGDIPGSLIPQTYHEYVRTGDITPLLPVFHHNALDLLTTLELLIEVHAPQGVDQSSVAGR